MIEKYQDKILKIICKCYGHKFELIKRMFNKIQFSFDVLIHQIEISKITENDLELMIDNLLEEVKKEKLKNKGSK